MSGFFDDEIMGGPPPYWVARDYRTPSEKRFDELKETKQAMKIYVASSWKNHLQPAIVHILKRAGHDVYDFRHPEPGNNGFKWQAVDPSWKPGDKLEHDQYSTLLSNPIAAKGYELDIGALKACDVVFLVMPSGRSACWEFGYAMGQGKRAYLVWFLPEEPDLMFREATIIGSTDRLYEIIDGWTREP